MIPDPDTLRFIGGFAIGVGLCVAVALGIMKWANQL